MNPIIQISTALLLMLPAIAFAIPIETEIPVTERHALTHLREDDRAAAPRRCAGTMFVNSSANFMHTGGKPPSISKPTCQSVSYSNSHYEFK